MARSKLSAPRKSSSPSYRRQARPSGKDDAFVELDGRRIYLGPYDSPDSRQKYHRLVAEWEASGRTETPAPEEITVTEVANRYMAFAKSYYVKNDHETAEPSNIALAIRKVLELYGRESAATFGPKALKLARKQMVKLGWSRKYLNKHVERVKRMFKWAVAEELVPPSVYEGLRTVIGVRYGREGVHDHPPVESVPIDRVEAMKPHLNRQVVAMLDLQLLTGARPGEVVLMRPCDIDRSGPVWVYRPHEHKTEHHGHDRPIFVGPKAQEILAPFLLRPADTYCFSPAEAETQRRTTLSINRTSYLSCGNSPGTNRKEEPQRVPGGRYTSGSYRRAISRAIEKAFPLPESLPKRERDETLEEWQARMTDEQREEYAKWRRSCWWHPHQLRHNYATMVRKQYGLEAAQILLGHSKADVTQVYAERDMDRAMHVAMKIG